MQKPGEAAATVSKQRWAIAEASEPQRRGAARHGLRAIASLRRFEAVNGEHIAANERLSDVVGGFSVGVARCSA